MVGEGQGEGHHFYPDLVPESAMRIYPVILFRVERENGGEASNWTDTQVCPYRYKIDEYIK